MKITSDVACPRCGSRKLLGTDVGIEDNGETLYCMFWCNVCYDTFDCLAHVSEVKYLGDDE